MTHASRPVGLVRSDMFRPVHGIGLEKIRPVASMIRYQPKHTIHKTHQPHDDFYTSAFILLKSNQHDDEKPELTISYLVKQFQNP